MARPPKPAVRLSHDDFNKQAWLKEQKTLAKDSLIEDRDRFRPLIRLKTESRELYHDLEKLDKKYEVSLMREKDQLRQFNEKQKQEVDLCKTLIKQASKQPEILDRVHQKCQAIEQNIKNFKLKSKATYQNLVEEEQALAAEISALEDKFETWASTAEA